MKAFKEQFLRHEKDKPVIKVTIEGRLMEDVKALIAELNREYGASHTLYIEVKF